MKRMNARRHSGAALAEGVAALWLIVSITAASVSLLINSGMSMFYKQKIAFCAMETATYTAGQRMDVDRLARGEEFAREIVKGMGLAVHNATIDIKETTVKDAPAISVRISIANLPLLHGEGGILPFSITIADQAVAIRHATPEAYVWLTNNAKMSGYLIPVTRIPAGGPNATGLPVIIP
jgi:hypothetical protein